MSKEEYAVVLSSLIMECLEYVGEKKILVLTYLDNFGFTQDQRFEQKTRLLIGLFRPMTLLKKPKYRDENKSELIKEQVDLYMKDFYFFQDECISILNKLKHDNMTETQILNYIQILTKEKYRLFNPSINDRSIAKLMGKETIFGKKFI